MINQKFAVIGVGNYGSTIARRLAEKGAEVFCFDSNEDKIENIKDDVAQAVAIDCTDVKAMISQGIKDIDVAVVAIGENFEATVLTSANLLDLGIKRIIARASGPNQKLILTKIGIEEILSPEDEVAFVVREKLLNPSIISFLQLPDNYEIAEVIAPKGVVGRSISDIDFRNNYELTLVTVKRVFDIKKDGNLVEETHVIGVPSGETVIEERDTLVIYGTKNHVERFLEINKS
ncbi:MAG: TrkA family potassium uptake protein [Crocinitomicaceae bacterium]|nr:TrkA family potassium uptake protein [Crocinitomicaceae bacterium]